MFKSHYKYPFAALFFLALSFQIPTCLASNSSIDASIQSYGDLSMFYQALVTTGVVNELVDGEQYTIFAPTNAAFASIERDKYPCFYAEQCRPQIASLLRNHIIKGTHDLPDLVTYGRIQTTGSRSLHVEQQYVNDYTVDDRKVLSEHETSGSYIYRIDGVLASPKDLTQFQTVTFLPTETPSTVVTKKTVTERTYSPDTSPFQPSVTTSSTGISDDSTQTTIIRTTTTRQ